MTSARPPVLANGTASDATVRMRMETLWPAKMPQPSTSRSGAGMILYVADPARPTRPARSETREVAVLRSVRVSHPELADAVDMHIELLELHRRVQGRVALPWFELNEAVIRKHNDAGEPLLRFHDIRIEPSDLRLLVRQIADVLRRHSALDDADYQRIQTIGRDLNLLEFAERWYRRGVHRHSVAAIGLPHDTAAAAPDDSGDEAL